MGISTYTFPWAIEFLKSGNGPVEIAFDLLSIAAENNISFVQFSDNLPLHCFAQHDLAAIKSFSSASNITLQAGTKRLTPENAQQYLDIAEYLQSPFLRMVIDDEDYHPSEQEVINTIHQLLPLLKQKKIKLAIENHDRFKALTLKSIIEKTDSEYIGICLDTANSFGAGEGINEVLYFLKPHVINLHVKDITIKRMNHKMGFTIEGAAAGDGIINIPSIINQLKETGRCNTATLELWSNIAGTMEETISKEKQLAEKSIHYLKQFLS